MMKWFAILFAITIVILIVLADTGRLGILRIVYWIPYGDKFGHFILFGILTLLVDLALLRSAPSRSPLFVVVLSGVVLAILIGLEEVSQLYISKRTFSIFDLGFGYAGVLVFSWIALRIKSSRRAQ
jgi:VanZ family protein